MYDRPNAIKGRYLKIHNMLISVAARVNHEVIDPWRLFNIIYIMRTKVSPERIHGLTFMIMLVDLAGSPLRLPAVAYRFRSDQSQILPSRTHHAMRSVPFPITLGNILISPNT